MAKPKVQNYEIEEKLGQGSFGAAYAATDTNSGGKVVLKLIIPEMKDKIDEARREFSLGQKANDACPFTVKYIELIQGVVPDTSEFEIGWRGKKAWWLILEYIPGYTLKQYNKCAKETGWRPDPQEWLQFLEWGFSTLDCLHKNGIVHGDLNEGNVYFSTKARELFFIDFGGSCDLNLTVSKSFVSAPSQQCALGSLATPSLYALPEINKYRGAAAFFGTGAPVPMPSEAEMRKIFVYNDVHCLLAISAILLDPNISLKTGSSWRMKWDIYGWPAVISDSQAQYEQIVGRPAESVFATLRNAFISVQQLRNGMDAEGMLKIIRNLKNQWSKSPKQLGGSIEELREWFSYTLGRIMTVSELKTMKELKLAHTGLKSLPESFGELSSLEILDLSNNKLESKGLPESFGNLKNLQKLWLSFNKLESLPESFGNLGGSLSQLNLVGNKLKSLPESFGNLGSSLKVLYLDNNNLESLPKSFGNLKELRELHLGNNKLKHLPESFGNLSSIRELDLTNNQLESLPESFGNLGGSLQELYLIGNKLKSDGLPKSFESLKNSLKELHIDKNMFKSLPCSIKTSFDITPIFSTNNKLKSYVLIRED